MKFQAVPRRDLFLCDPDTDFPENAFDGLFVQGGSNVFHSASSDYSWLQIDLRQASVCVCSCNMQIHISARKSKTNVRQMSSQEYAIVSVTLMFRTPTGYNSLQRYRNVQVCYYE